jgi:hypothetical protein
VLVAGGAGAVGHAAIRAIAPRGIDLVVEVAPSQNAAVVAPRASIAIYADNGGDDVTLDVRPTWWPTRATSSSCCTPSASRR